MPKTEGKLILNGSMEIVKITEDLYSQAIKLYQDYFMKYENVSIATDLLGSQETIDEMEIMIREILKDQVSFAVRDLKTNELVAMSVNKIIDPSVRCTLDDVMSKFKTKNMICVGHYLERMENTVNLFDKWSIECVFEIVFLSTRMDYAGKGLATEVARHSIDFAKQIGDGDLPKHIENLRPKAVCSVFTGHFSQRVGQKLGLETIYEVPNSEFSFEGKTFAEKIDPIHKKSVFAAKLL